MLLAPDLVPAFGVRRARAGRRAALGPGAGPAGPLVRGNRGWAWCAGIHVVAFTYPALLRQPAPDMQLL
jgi:hypothetical protein